MEEKASAAHGFLQQICAPPTHSGEMPRICLVVAHPDDEVIGAGARLPTWRSHLELVHVTDGAPRDGQDAQAQGFLSLEDYAQARRLELDAALELAGITAQQRHELNYADKTVRDHLASVARDLFALFARLQPNVIVTHPYEGGHPDHDATAFAVYAACDLLTRTGQSAPVLVEMASYHAGEDGLLRVGTFLPNEDGSQEEVTLALSPEERTFKQCLYDCFPTQSWILENFPIGVERFRLAPRYDFGRLPHTGVWLYENYGWGLTGAAFTRLAQQAVGELGL